MTIITDPDTIMDPLDGEETRVGRLRSLKLKSRRINQLPPVSTHRKQANVQIQAQKVERSWNSTFKNSLKR